MQSRRDFVALSTAFFAPGFQPGANADALRSEFLLDLTIDARPPDMVGFPGGERAIVTVAGGSFQGPRLKGTIAPGGGDWIVQRPDGSRLLDVRLVMTTDDGKKIFVSWRGVAYTENGALFARIIPMFETGADKYAWLNRIVSVGVYRPQAGAIAYRVFRVL